MIRHLLALSAFAFTSLASATSSIMFAKDGSKATVLLLALSQNPSAIAFNEVMNVPVEDVNGKDTKKITYLTPTGAKSFDAICVFSKLVAATGSCTLVFHAGGGAGWSVNSHSLNYELTGEDAKVLGARFVIPVEGGIFYESNDGFLQMKAFMSEGQIQKLQIFYSN